jgi:hypothetical protein
MRKITVFLSDHHAVSCEGLQEMVIAEWARRKSPHDGSAHNQIDSKNERQFMTITPVFFPADPETHVRINRTKRTVMGFVLALAVMFPILDSTAAQAPVDLGSAGGFAVLAKTGISTTGTTAITGDIGVSPAAATFITGFGLIMDASGQFSSSSLVTGKVYAADYAVPTPTKMTAAVSDMQTAYTAAAGRTLPDYTELYAGDVTGQTLTPGLYKWGTAVLVSAGGVTISGSASDVWIFQIAQNLTVANGAIVTLSGGAQPSNIFWQVAGQVTLGTTAAMKGIILCQTLIEVQTGATLSGRALAQTAVTFDANSVTVPNTVTGSVILVSAGEVAGQYTNASGQSVNLATRTITVPMSGSTQFYRIRSDTALTIMNTTISGGNVVITYN